MSDDLRALPPGLDRARNGALAVGVVAIVACAAGAFSNPSQFLRSYLWSYVFWIGIPLGCLAILMLQHLTGGRWGVGLRRLLESATRTLPVLALGFVPIALGLGHLYEWADPAAVQGDAILQHKAAYLNVPFFLARTVVYFALWIGLAHLLNRWSGRQDERADPRLGRKLQAISGPGLAAYVLTMSFASVDWVMSLEPHWFSTIFGGLFISGQVLAAMSFCIAVAVVLAREKPLSLIVTPDRLHDMGKLMLTFVMVWAYFAFSQFLIIWAGNLPEEIPWYLRRFHGGWQWVGLALVILHFALPFLLLLSRGQKRNPAALARIAWLVIAMRVMDMYWTTAPAFGGGVVSFHWMDLAAPVGVGGLWLAAFLWQVRRRPLIPVRDPYVQEVFDHAGR